MTKGVDKRLTNYTEIKHITRRLFVGHFQSVALDDSMALPIPETPSAGESMTGFCQFKHTPDQRTVILD